MSHLTEVEIQEINQDSLVIHIDIKNEKVWIQWNETEVDIAAKLVAVGVPKEDIVLGFQPPFMRQFTEYAVG